MSKPGWYSSDGYDPIGLNVVTWPVVETVENGNSHTYFEIETFAGLDGAAVSRVGQSRVLNRLDRMCFEMELVGDRKISVKCSYDTSMLIPERIGVASAAWRYLDENLSRIWRIGGFPRVFYPEFMRQRRELVDRLTEARRWYLLWLCLGRAEPVLSAMTGPDEGSWSMDVSDLDVEDMVVDIALKYRGMLHDASLSAARPDLTDVVLTLAKAMNAAVGGFGGTLTDNVSYSMELIFAAEWRLSQLFGAASTSGLAEREDIAWFEDLLDLMRPGALDSGELAARCQSARRLASVSVAAI